MRRVAAGLGTRRGRVEGALARYTRVNGRWRDWKKGKKLQKTRIGIEKKNSGYGAALQGRSQGGGGVAGLATTRFFRTYSGGDPVIIESPGYAPTVLECPKTGNARG